MQRYTSNPPSRRLMPHPWRDTTPRAIHAAIIRFIARNQMTESRFGREALNDPAFVSRLRAGAMPNENTCRRLDAYMAEARHA